jgi:hypothetical protein
MTSPAHSVPLHTFGKAVPEDLPGTICRVAKTGFTAAANAGTHA